jgi:TPR repeat protein
MRILAFLLLFCASTRADFQAGLAAYDRGDYQAALKEWQPIAERGDANAQYNLGLLYARGQGVSQDYAKAVDWYRKAAESGVPAAQYNLGVMYANGQGVPANAAEARKWFLAAAEQGVGDAATGLGSMYREEGQFKNYAEAERWYRKAAEQGVASAAFQLGVMYDVGQGVEKNYEQALKWYRQAADAGYAGALTNIGILYYNAQGVKRDLVQSYAWFARAEKAGDPRAAELVKVAASKMKPNEVKKAQSIVDEWQPSKKQQADQVASAGLFRPQTAASGAAAPAAPAAFSATGEASRQTAAVAGKPVAAPVAAVPNTWTGVDRIVAVGDAHGDYEQFVLALESAGLIDGSANWTGGKTHLVQTGDVVDRGPDSRKIMDLLMRLEDQAKAVGGAVHCLIGNHEAMDIYGDLRFVSPGEYSAFAGASTGSADREIGYGQNRAALTAAASPEPGGRSAFENPPGFEQHRAAFATEGAYGKWIRSHNAAIKIDRTLFVHAGLGPKYASWSLDRIDHQVRQELNDFTRLHGGIVTDEEGPLWYKGLAKGDEQKLAPLVDGLLENFGVDRIVVGHSYADAAITPRFGGKVVLIDIGLSRIYDNVGKLGALVIENGKAWALHRGQKLELPKDEGADMLRYLKEAAALDPQPSPLRDRIARLGGK